MRAFLALLLLAACGGSGTLPPGESLDLLADLDRAEISPPLAAADGGGEWAYGEDFEGAQSWQVRAWRSRAEGGPSADQAHGGGRSMTLASVDATGADAEVFRLIPVAGNTRYRFVGHLRTEGVAPISARVFGSFYLMEYRSRAEFEGRFTNPPKPHLDLPDLSGTSDGWQRLEYTFTTMQETRLLKIAGSLGNWGRATGRVFFNDVELWRLPTPGVFEAAGGATRVGSYRLGEETRRAMALPAPGSFETTLWPDPGAVLDFALGVPGDPGEGVGRRARLLLTAERDGERSVVFERVLTAADGWSDASVSLAGYAGDEITLPLEASAAGGQGGGAGEGSPLAVYWAHPRLRAAGARPSAPSVVCISIDTLRADHVGHLGYERDTPHLDRLAAEGVSFDQAVSPSPWTLPAHASMLTAAFPSRHRADDRVGLGPGLATAG